MRKTGGEIQYESEGLWIEELMVQVSAWIRKLENKEHQCVWRLENIDVSAQAQRVSLPFLHLFVLFSSSTEWIKLTHFERAICFTQFTNSNANLFWKHFTDTLRNNVLPDIWASLSPVKLTLKINDHTREKGSLESQSPRD